WVSLWNDSSVVELDLVAGKIGRRLELGGTTDQTAPRIHPTVMRLGPGEDRLYVALSNASAGDADGVAAVDLSTGAVVHTYAMALGTEPAAGATPIGIALSDDGKRLYAVCASLDAVAVFNVERDGQSPIAGRKVSPMGFIPTEWYPSAVAASGDDLLIASAKGKGAGPNNMHA